MQVVVAGVDYLQFVQRKKNMKKIVFSRKCFDKKCSHKSLKWLEKDTIPHRELYICIAKQHTLSSYIRRNSELNMSSLPCIHRLKQRHPHSRLITNFIEFEIQRLSSIVTQQFKSSNIQKNIRRNASNKKHHLKFVLSYDNTVWCEKISTKDMPNNSQSALFFNIRITI